MPSAAERARRDRRAPEALLAAALFFAALAAFWPVRGHQFVNFDDPAYVYKNAAVLGGLSREGLGYAFTSLESGNWHPLTWLSHMLDVHLHGRDPGRHHLTSALIHALSAALLFVALRRMTGAAGRSAVAAAAFALHPLRAESVAWLSERKDVLAGLFWMLTLLAYLRWARRPGRGRAAAVAATFAVGLTAKPMLVTLPLVLVLLDFWPLGRLRPPGRRGVKAPPAPGTRPLSRLLLEKAPLLALSAAASAVAVIAQGHGNAIGSSEKYTLAIRAANAAWSYVSYIAKTVWPLGLTMFYPHPGPALGALKPAGAALALALLTLPAMLAWRSRPYLACGWLWFLGALVPVVGVIQIGKQGMADRYTYLPGIGLAVAAAWGAHAMLPPARRSRRGTAAAAAVLAVLAAMTNLQARAWHDNESMYRHALAVDPDSHMALSVFGTLLTQLDRVEEGTELLERAYRSSPAMIAAFNVQAGDLHALRGRRGAALERYRRALRHDPGNRDALTAIARLQDAGSLAGGLAPGAGGAKPAAEEAASWFRSGNAFAGEGDCERAIACYLRAVELDAGHAEAWNNLGSCYGRLGREREAAEAFARAVAAAPDSELARKNLERSRLSRPR